MLWPWLEKRGCNPGNAIKNTLGLFAVAKLKYGRLLNHMLWLGLGAALLALLLSPLVKRRMHDVH